MSTEPVKITDKKQIYEILQTRFKTGKIFIKTSDINIQVESFLFDNGLVSITGPFENEKVNSVILYIRDKDEVIFSHAVLKSKDENCALNYEPLDIQIAQIPRKEERKNVSSIDKTVKAPLYISNIISDFTVHECLNLSRRKVDLIKDELLKKLQDTYPDSEIVFLSDKGNDPRMFYFKNKRKPYFIKNISDADDPEKVHCDEDLKYYKTYIQPRDPLGHKAKTVSEICVPLLYKMMMPFGYIKSASYKELNDEDFSAVRKFGMSASTVYTNDKQLIISSNDNIAVTDLSMSGLGIFFKDKVLIKHFKENSLIIFTVFLPEKKQATLLCEVKNIALIKNYIYRIGCEILNIEALGEVYYSEYIEGHKSD
ncbi:MAG TPA: hypothetical protein PKG60_06145 [Spirochaetota bacterium]|mgnify:CR=1 FL=1|nr:hypothetical protein [Spirochaetota bacterium]HPS85687.1 hypothetical protein [Spirochaetota bacterium]